jgi:L-fuculose-phosphate aldolase
MRRREPELRAAIVSAAKTLNASGLSPGRSGNISVRWKSGMLITASGIPAKELTPDADVVFVEADGSFADAGKLPSSEWHFHQAIYASRADVEAVVHCHSRFSTALACARKPIPAFHYMVAKAGGEDIPLAPYDTYGTPELAAAAASALASRNACLLANHGQIAIGQTLEEALELAEEVESLAAQYIAACAAGGAVLLSEGEMLKVADKFKTYGKAANPPKSVGTKSRSR